MSLMSRARSDLQTQFRRCFDFFTTWISRILADTGSNSHESSSTQKCHVTMERNIFEIILLLQRSFVTKVSVSSTPFPGSAISNRAVKCRIYRSSVSLISKQRLKPSFHEPLRNSPLKLSHSPPLLVNLSSQSK